MKRITSLFLGLFMVVSLFAQISTSWTTEIATTRLPSGATIPAVAALTSPSRVPFTVDLTPASTYDNATETTAFTAIGDATKVAIDSNFVVEVWGLNPAADITGRILITDITRRWDNFTPGDLPNQYTAATDIFRVTGWFEWVITP